MPESPPLGVYGGAIFMSFLVISLLSFYFWRLSIQSEANTTFAFTVSLVPQRILIGKCMAALTCFLFDKWHGAL